MMRTLYRSILTSVFTGLLPLAAMAVELPGPVVDAKWLKDHRSEVQILDTRSGLDTWTDPPQWDGQGDQRKLSYSGGHIEGALALDYDQMRINRQIGTKTIKKLVPEAAQVQALLRAAGLKQNQPIVVTSVGDTVGDMDSAVRVYWTLKYFATDAVAILDGGNAAWLQSGFPISTEAVSNENSGDWTASGPNAQILSQMADVEKAIEEGVQLIDARPVSQFLGVYKKSSAAAAGHLAGARNFPADARYRADGVAQRFLRAEEYRKLFTALGIAAETPSIAYCNSGHMASSQWFIQSEILGTNGVSLYDGSIYEWTQLGKPVVGLE